MIKPKIIDCITFFDNNFMFNLRYKILEKYVDYFVVCESLFDHVGKRKKKNFVFRKDYKKNKIKYICMTQSFPKKNSPWQNQAMQREYLLNSLNFTDFHDYIFFSDPDEIPKPELLKNFNLKKKYGIFMLDCFNYKFNLFNQYESPWEGTRVAQKKDLNSLNYLRQNIKSKNLKYGFYRFDKEKDIQIFHKGGWHFNNIMSANQISKKLKSFAHQEFSDSKFSDTKIIKNKINKKIDLFNRGHVYKKVKKVDSKLPDYIKNNIEKYKRFFCN